MPKKNLSNLYTYNNYNLSWQNKTEYHWEKQKQIVDQ